MSPAAPLEPLEPRAPYRRDQLTRLFAPRSIAVVGVSNNPSAFGSVTWSNIVTKGGFAGAAYRVNARQDRIGDAPCYRSVADLPEAPDCVFVAVPRDAVEAVVGDCAERGAGGVVIFSSGFAETAQPQWVALQQRLLAIGREADLRLVGPNCVGYMNYGLGVIGTFGAASFKGAPRPGAIGLVSQSGAVGAALVQAMEHGVPFSHLLTCGNACDVDVADQVAYLAEDPACRAIACVFEGMAEPARFLAAAEACARAGKPLVVHKLGTSARGAQAAVSHTGSVAGSQVAYRAAFERSGVVMVDEVEALIDTCSFFAKAPAPRARGVAVAAVSGGACIMLADQAEPLGIALPHPQPRTMAVLERLVPAFGSPGNPCDLTAQVLATPQHLSECFDALLADPQYGVLVVPHTFAYPAATARIALMADAAGRHGKLACSVWLTQHLEGPGAEETETNPRVALFRSMRHCMAALAAWHWRADWLAARQARLPRRSPARAADRAAALIARAQAATLTEREGKAVLAEYGVPVVSEVLARDADEAVAAQRAFGGAVAMKVESPDIAHKTEADAIRLGPRTEAEVREAFAIVIDNARRHRPDARIHGVLMQPLVPKGTEVMIGARVDPQLGPMVVVGLGGILVELLGDAVARLAPVDVREAAAMLGALRGQRALQGFRGAPPVNIEALADIVARVSELIADQCERVIELDVNPLVCGADGMLAVDALIVRRPA